MKMLLNPRPLEARQAGSGAAPTQGARRATGGCAPAGDRRDPDISPPDPEVTEAKPRRRFTAAYKLRVIDQADQCSEPGQIGALLRREGLYSSHLKQCEQASFGA